MPRVLTSVGLVALLLFEAGCRSAAEPAPKWQVGYWLWDHYGRRPEFEKTSVDVLYAQAGGISNGYRNSPFIHGSWPDATPRANEYWAVFRKEVIGIPDGASAKAIAYRVVAMRQEMARTGISLRGVQMDIDSPTASLHDYAIFLRALKAELPKGAGLSITALLDWFRPGTQIDEVIKEVDEFVPQFYDTGESYGRYTIGAPIQPAKWAPQFNRFGKRYRIGISTFGRTRIQEPARNAGSDAQGLHASWISPDTAPRDFATAPGFELDASTNPTGELILRYRAVRKTRVGFRDFPRGSLVEFVLATEESVKNAVARARQFGGHCAGVVFFRWPTPSETMALPAEVVLGNAGKQPVELRVVDRDCAAVHCVELIVKGLDPWSPTATQFVVESTGEIDYFLPSDNSPARMAGPSRLEFTVPRYAGVSEIRLGTAVAGAKSNYALKELH
jgi:hypothetical protein